MSKLPNLHAICPHGVKMVMCDICNGGQICIHTTLRITCLYCLELDSMSNRKNKVEDNLQTSK